MISTVHVWSGRLKPQMANLLLAAAAFCGCATKPATGTRAEPIQTGFTIFMIGDSTMADKPVIPPNPERG
jgi:hypothetical protein